MYRNKLFVLTLICLVAFAGLAMAQQLPAPGTLGPSARAVGMGGAFVAVADDASAPMWNPAGEDASKSFKLPVGAFGMAQGFDADEIKDLIDDVDDARNGSFAAANSLFGTAVQGRNIQIAGTPYLSIGPVMGVSLYGSVDASGMIALSSPSGDLGVAGLSTLGESIRTVATVGAVGSVGVAFNRDMGDGVSLGIGLKHLEYRGRGFDYTATLTAPNTIGSVATIGGFDTPEIEDSMLSVDLGLLYRPEDPEMLSFGLVARDVTRPEVSNQGIAFSIPRQIDVGIAKRTATGMLFAADLHDLTGSRTGKATLHVGLEIPANDWLTWRVGMYEQPQGFNDPLTFVGGVGAKLGSFSLNLAAGTTLSEYLAGELSWTF